MRPFKYRHAGSEKEAAKAVAANSSAKFLAGAIRLSPDGKNVLLPTKKNGFILYTLGKDSMKIPVEEDEGYKDDNMSAYLSVWKGNDEISYLASEKSRFLRKEGQEKHHRKEFVILGADCEFRRVLSEKWPELSKND